jgi:RHS repeat-associated protein
LRNKNQGLAQTLLLRSALIASRGTPTIYYAYGGDNVINEVDAGGNLLSKTDRKNQTIQYGYDALYRLTSKTYPDSTAVNYTYDPLSRLTQVTDPSGAYSFTYDNLGRLLGTNTQYSFFGSALTNSYTYDAASNRISFTNSESGITYGYDSLNRLTTLTDSNTGQFGFGYDALGRRTSLTRPNGIGTSYSYDTLSRLLSVLHNGGALPGSTAYTYDAAGNRLTKTAVEAGTPNPVSVLSQYSYDNIYQLTQAVVNASVAEGYSYDAVGNRLSSTGPVSYNYNASNELTSTSATTYTYDNNGNTLSKTDSTGTTNYAWDFENRLTQVTLPAQGGTVYFNYDPFGRRIRKSSSGGTTIFAYDGATVVEELDSSGNVTARYTQGAGIDAPLAMYRGFTTSYYHSDGLGSIVSLTDASGQLAASYLYDSFGNLTASTGTITNPYQYTGREFDSETGLYYYRARYYDPIVGRFLSEDPIGFDGEANFYPYVRNNPVIARDPTGLYVSVPGADMSGIAITVEPDIDADCKSKPAGACSLVNAEVDSCECPCTGSGNRLVAHLRPYGHIFVSSGPFPYKNRSPMKDLSVTDPMSAYAHELNAHIKPAIEAAMSVINKAEAKPYRSKDECKKACNKLEKSAPNAFNLSLQETKREEEIPR